MMTRVLALGCLEPSAGYAEMETQLRLSSRYRNALVELERTRRERVTEATRAEFPRMVELEADLTTLNEQIATLDEEIKRDNATTRRKRASAEQQTRKKELREQRSLVYATLRELKRDAYGPEEITDLRAAIKAAQREGNTAEVARLEGQMVEAVAQWHERVPGAARLRENLTAADQDALDRQKELRAACGLYWGNYLCVEDAASTFRQGAPPDFRRYDGQGRLGVQIQGGITVAALLECTDQRVKLELLSQESGSRQARLWFRVGSTSREVMLDGRWAAIDSGSTLKRRDGIHLRYTLADGTAGVAAPGQWRGEANAPVWCVIPCVYHRDLPADAIVKQVYLLRRKVGYHWTYSVSLVCTGPDSCWERPDLAAAGTVAINLGWRTLPDGSIRVAYWVGSDGAEGSLSIARADIDARWDLPEQLQATRSLLLTEAIDKLATWCEEHEHLLPESFASQLRDRGDSRRTLRQWRSSERLYRVVERWRYNRFAGDEEIYAWMEGISIANPRGNGRARILGFRRQEKHLCDWQAGIRQRAERWRKDVYRNFAAMLSRRYQTAVLADVNWREMGERPEAESNESENRTAKRNARIAAPGEMELILRNRMGSVQLLESPYLTQRCAECGKLDAFDARTELVRVCRHCDCTEDQDRRHCRNLLRSASGEVVNETP